MNKNIKLKSIAVTVAAVAYLSLTMTGLSVGQSTSWTGNGGNNNFSASANWSNGVPNVNTVANFHLSSVTNVNLTGVSQARRISSRSGEAVISGGFPLFTEITNTVADEGHLRISGNNTRIVTNDIFNIGDQFGDGKLTIENDAVVEFETDAFFLTSFDSDTFVTSGGQLIGTDVRSGNGANSTAYIEVNTAGSIFSNLARIGQIPTGNDSARVTDNGSVWTTDELCLGINGAGTLFIENGGLFEAESVVLGQFSNSTGTLNVSGAGSELTVEQDMVIGGGGVGHVDITGGTATVGGQTTISPGSTFEMTSAVFTGTELINEGTMNFLTSGFANLDTNVAIIDNGSVQVTTFAPVNFLRDVRHNGLEIFVEAGERVNFFGEYTGRGPITGTGVVHFRDQVEPGVNDNQFLYGTIGTEGDIVIEGTANLFCRINGADQTASDQIQAAGDVTLQSPELEIAIDNAAQFQIGDEIPLVTVGGNLSGTFQASPEGAVVPTNGSIEFQISYSGGDGNDIVLVVVGDDVATPNNVNVFRGITIAGDLAEVQNSDNSYLRMNPGFTLNSSEAPVWVEFFGTAGGALSIEVESQAGTPGLTYTTEAWNWSTSSYEEIGTQVEAFNNDQVGSFAMIPNHIDSDGSVRTRVGWRQTGFTLNFPWEVRIDQVSWQ